MKQTIDLYQFRDAFVSCGRGEQFSYEGIEVLYEWLEECSNDMGEDIEFDVIGLCCEFNESTPGEIIEDYSLEGFRENNAVSAITGSQWRVFGDRENDELIEYLNDRTLVCGQTDTTIIYQAF